MNQSTRQRIVGTVVLVLVAIVLLPIVFDGDGATQLEQRIPAAPETPEVPTIQAQRPEITADSDAILLNERSLPESETPVAVGVDEPAAELFEAETAETGSAEGGTTETAEETQPVAANTEPGLDVRGLPEAWSVQLGAFSNQNNVKALVDRLLEAGHPAYARAITSAQGNLTGVYVGPKVDREEAVRLVSELEESFELAGRVVRYQIEEQ